MKTIKYITAIIILALSTQIGFATNDGTSLDKSPVIITLEMKSLFPVVPAMADFSEAEIEHMTNLLRDLSIRFAPEQPEEADFDDQPTEMELFSPEVPEYAPYTEAL